MTKPAEIKEPKGFRYEVGVDMIVEAMSVLSGIILESDHECYREGAWQHLDAMALEIIRRSQLVEPM